MKYLQLFFFIIFTISSCSTQKGTYCEFPMSPVDLSGIAKSDSLNKPIFIGDLNKEEFAVTFKNTSIKLWPDSCLNKHVLIHGFKFLENEKLFLRDVTFKLNK